MKDSNEKVVLTISLLTSNRPDTIERCLDSVRDFMAKLDNRGISSELVLVDTSGNPAIRDILVKYTDRIYPFQWCDDFAAARNVGVDHARGDYFMFLDDDEWLVDMDPLVEAFAGGQYKEYEVINHKIRNFFDKKMESYSEAWVSRIMRTGEGQRFHSKIHEYFTPPKGPTLQVPALSYHSGYIFESDEERIRHARRNIVLLEKMIVEEPEEPRWKKQLCQEYWVQSDWDLELKFTEEQLPLVIHKHDPRNVEAIAALRICMIESLIMKEKYVRAERVVLEGLCDKRHEQITYAYFRIQYARICFRTKRYDEGIKNCLLYLKAYKVLAHNEAYMASQAAALMSNDAFDEFRYVLAVTTYIMCALKKKDTSILKKYYEDLGWDKDVLYIPEYIVEVLTEAMTELPYDSIFARAYTDLFRNRFVRNACFKAIYEYHEDKEKHDRLLYVLSNCTGEDWFIYYAKILRAAKEKVDRQQMEELVKGFFRDASNVLVPPEDLLEIFEEYGIDERDYWKLVPFSKWCEHVDGFLQKANEEQKKDLKAHMKELPLAEEDMRCRYYLLQYDKGLEGLREFYTQIYAEDILRFYPSLLPAYAAVLFPEHEDMTEEVQEWKQEIDYIAAAAERAISYITVNMDDCPITEMTAKFWNYAYYVMDYSGVLYRKEIMEQYPDVMSAEARAAKCIYDAFSSQPWDLEGITRNIMKACLEYPELLKNCRRLADRIVSLPRPTEELLKMADTVKTEILGMSRDGRMEEAAQTIQQLRAILPFYIELICWEREIHEG